VILSHDDLDHSGGIHQLLETTSVGEVIAGTPGLQAITETPCIRGLEWSSGRVIFRVLHPKADTPWSGNNASCVLEIRTGETSVLLPGDIERPVEILMAYRREIPKSEVVIVPHHGSRTSSSDALVGATRPAIAVVPSAWKNRWGFPKPDVVNRWRQSGALVLNTASDGAISMRVCTDGLGSFERNRQRYRRYWHEDRKPPS
jgi:competence protein ComEC